MRLFSMITLPIAVVMLGLSAGPAQAQWFGNSANSRADSKSAAVTANNFATQQNTLRSQINSAVSTGRISSATASTLMAQLNQANAMSQNALASGNLTNQDVNSVMAIFSSIGNTLSAGGSQFPYANIPYGANPNPSNPYGGTFYNTNPYGVNTPYYGNLYAPYF